MKNYIGERKDKMSTTTVYTLATWKDLAKEIWQEHKGALALISNQYLALHLAQPKGKTAKELYVALPKEWQDRVKVGSFGAQLSLAGRVHREFTSAKKAGQFPKDANSAEFVARLGSLDKALKVLNPAKVDPKDVTPKAKKAESVKAEGVATKASVKMEEDSKFATVVKMVDELNESDLKALAMVVADKIAKMTEKATAKV